MTPRIKFAFVTLTRIACLVSLLSGCATVTQEPDRTSSQTPATATGLRIPSTESATSTPSLRRSSQLATASRPADASLPSIEIPPQPQITQVIDLTIDVDDLFLRMRNGFSMPDINNDLVLYHQQWYMSRPDYLRRMVERSSLYMHHIVEELDKRGMPMELALLPMVESAYNPMAYSRSKASGLWQFIPSTGKHYNLDQNWWKDERRDIVASTTAALDYLQSIYEMHGDWQLALASYNWGEGAVGRAINKNRALGLPTDYLSLTMPGETKNYVPKLQALKNIFSNPALLVELGLLKIPNRPFFSTVTKTANIDVNVAAKLAEMPIKEFVALNPAHNQPVIQSETPIIIPADKLDTFISNLETYESSNKPLSYWQSYTMHQGDKLEKIASRFGMTVANLKAANGIRGKFKVHSGITLLVAGQEGGDSPDAAPPAEQPRLPSADPTPVTAKTTASHTVRKGETLPVIAKRYGVSIAELKRINHLRSDKLVAGSRLMLASESKTSEKREAKSGKTADSPEKKDNAKNAPKTTRYVIRRGDTLTSIAKHFNVSKDDILRWNRISPNALKPGNALTIQLAQKP